MPSDAQTRTPPAASPTSASSPTWASPPRYADWDDASLVGRSASGDDAAFAALVQRYQGPLYRHALRLTPDRRLAEDVVQEAFITAWRRLPTLQDPAAFRSWLYQITTRRSIDAFRAQKPEVPVDTTVEETQQVAATGPGPEGRAEQRAQMGDLAAALRELPVGQRAAWSMREIDGLSYEEIATALGVPVSTVRGRIARARGELLERMGAWRTTRD